LASALTLTPMAAAQPEAAKPADLTALSKQIEEMRKTLEGLQNSVLAFNKTMEQERNERMKADADMEVRLQQLLADTSDAKKQMTQLRQDMDALKARPSMSAYQPSTPASGTGRVRLVNTYIEPVSVVVNGKAYPLTPGETRLTDPMPAGNFTYEVLGIQAPTTRTLAANETFTVTVFPR
jgi:hypothetical protein